MTMPDEKTASEEDVKKRVMLLSEMTSFMAEHEVASADFFDRLLHTDAGTAEKLLRRIGDMVKVFRMRKDPASRAAFRRAREMQSLYMNAVEEAGYRYEAGRIVSGSGENDDEGVDKREAKRYNGKRNKLYMDEAETQAMIWGQDSNVPTGMRRDIVLTSENSETLYHHVYEKTDDGYVKLAYYQENIRNQERITKIIEESVYGHNREKWELSERIHRYSDGLELLKGVDSLDYNSPEKREGNDRDGEVHRPEQGSDGAGSDSLGDGQIRESKKPKQTESHAFEEAVRRNGLDAEERETSSGKRYYAEVREPSVVGRVNRLGQNWVYSKEVFNNNRQKQEIVVLLDEAIIAAGERKETANSHEHGWLDNFGMNKWEHWTVLCQEKSGRIWSAKLNIAMSNTGERYFYDVDKIEEVKQDVKSPTSITSSDKQDVKSPTSTSVDSISQNLNLSIGSEKKKKNFPTACSPT